MQEWFNEFWDESEPFDLAGLYAHRWDPHSPWIIFLRMLWEYHGDHLRDDDDDIVRTQLHLRVRREFDWAFQAGCPMV